MPRLRGVAVRGRCAARRGAASEAKRGERSEASERARVWWEAALQRVAGHERAPWGPGLGLSYHPDAATRSVAVVATEHPADTVARAAGVDSESAYLAGLLHETGHLILCQADPQEAQRHFGKGAPTHGSVLQSSEREVFGIAHPEVGGYWCDEMQLPDEIGAVVRTYLDTDPEAKTSLGVVIQVATALAGFVQSLDTAEQAFSRVEGLLLQLPGLDSMAFERGFDECFAKLRTVTAAGEA
jgi:hypothetical protein